MSQIAKRVRAAALTKLADATFGFNVNVAAAVATGAYGNETAMTIDFVNIGKSCFLANLTPEDIEDTTPSLYPMAFLFTTRTRNTGEQKFNLFSGLVELGLDIHVSWRDGRAAPVFEDRGDLIEDAVIKTFNDGSLLNFLPVTVTYNGDVSVARSPIAKAGEHWRQALMSRFSFMVNTN